MENKVFGFILLTLLFAFQTQAALKIPNAGDYESGRFLCESKYKNFIEHEKGFYTSVLIDVQNPQKGQTPVYAFFLGGYDASKETFIYFTGGPGQTAHWTPFRVEVNSNILVIEQRGIGCSRPDSLATYLDPQFYSSEHVARDAKQIIDSLKIAKVSVYGISYGTAPATIFASLYPSNTKAVVLEGTLFSGDNQLWEAPHRRKLLEKMLATLPAEVTNLLHQITTQYELPSIWFSQMARSELLTNDGLASFRKKLMGLTDPASFGALIQQLQATYEPTEYAANPLFIANDIPYHMISCQELGLSNSQVSTADALVNGRKLVPVMDRESLSNCQQLKASAQKPYDSRNYPIQVPVTYFQGSDDSATPAPGAIHHYKSVPKAFAQLLILVQGGHNPNLQIFNSDNPLQKEIFELALKGQRVPPKLLQKFNADSDLKWVMTSKPK